MDRTRASRARSGGQMMSTEMEEGPRAPGPATSRRCRTCVWRALVLLACLVILAVPVDAAAQTLDERLQRGQQLLQEGQFEQALAELQQVIDDSPNSAAALYYAGRALGRLQRFDESFDYLVRASELDPGNGPVHQAACIAAAQGRALRGRVEPRDSRGAVGRRDVVDILPNRNGFTAPRRLRSAARGAARSGCRGGPESHPNGITDR